MKRRLKKFLTVLLCTSMIMNLSIFSVAAEETPDSFETVSANEIVEETEMDVEMQIELDMESGNRNRVDPYLNARLAEKTETIEVLENGTIIEKFSASDRYNEHLLGMRTEAHSEVYNIAYEKCVDAMESFSEGIVVQISYPQNDKLSEQYRQEIEDAYVEALYSNVDFCMYDDWSRMTTRINTSNGISTMIANLNLQAVKDPIAMRNAVKTAYIEVIKDGMSDLDKMLALHDYLCLINTYDYTLSKYTAYNALVDRTSVCQGYFEAYKLLLGYQGIPSKEASGENHIWNQVYVNGSWYNVDCTWDSEEDGKIRHDYFLGSDAKFENHGHSFKNQDEYCINTSFDEALWYGNVETSNGYMSATKVYYLEHDSHSAGYGNVILHEKNPRTGADTIVKISDGKWELITPSGIKYVAYGSNSARMWPVNGCVYYNDAHSVYQIKPDGCINTLVTYSSNTLIYGLNYNNGKLKVTLFIAPTSKDTDELTEEYREISIPFVSFSTELSQIEQFVSRMYTVVLNREAEGRGLAYWSMQLSYMKQDGAAISGGFFNSEEFRKRGLNNSAYLDVLYRTFFDRESDSDGKNYWLQCMASGMDRTAVLSEFVNSKEFAAICDRYGIARGTMKPDGTSTYNAGARNYVLRMYTKALGRSGETMGVEYWTDQIVQRTAQPVTVAKEFFFSQEYLEKHLDDSAYLDTLYETFMGRTADEDGKNYWLYQMNYLGMSREKVLEEFSVSPEFRQIMAGYGL